MGLATFSRPRVNARLQPPGEDGDPNDQDDPNECWTETVTDVYDASVPDESDGIVSVQTGVWSEGDFPNDRDHNFLFDDDGGGQNGTGFNHAEMVYNRRRFSSYADPAYYDVSFQRGDLNPPMVNARNWIRDRVFGSPN